VSSRHGCNSALLPLRLSQRCRHPGRQGKGTPGRARSVAGRSRPAALGFHGRCVSRASFSSPSGFGRHLAAASFMCRCRRMAASGPQEEQEARVGAFGAASLQEQRQGSSGFNCFSDKHIARCCLNRSRCFRCREPGHQARDCPRPWVTPVARRGSGERGHRAAAPSQQRHRRESSLRQSRPPSPAVKGFVVGDVFVPSSSSPSWSSAAVAGGRSAGCSSFSPLQKPSSDGDVEAMDQGRSFCVGPISSPVNNPMCLEARLQPMGS
jgi:hypothetical protein